MLNNYVVQHIGSASVTARFGSFAIFLLLNDSSHDPHFSACQSIETLDGIQKNFEFFFSRVFQIFDSKHGSPEDYSDFFFVFCFCFSSSSRTKAMRSPRHNSSKMLSNRN